MWKKLFSELEIGDVFVFKNRSPYIEHRKEGHRLYRRVAKGAGVSSLYNPHEVVYILPTYGHHRLAALKQLSGE